MKIQVLRNLGLGTFSVLCVSGIVYGFSGWEGVENATNGDSLTHTVWNSFVDGVVKKTGSVAETITGVKTFSSAPIVPTPTADTEAANKQYVDDNNSSGFSANISSQSIPSAITTKLQFDTEHYDINNEYDNSPIIDLLLPYQGIILSPLRLVFKI